MIREMKLNDSERILEIYKMGLETKNATFETEVPSCSEWDLKHHKHSRFVYADTKLILGWAALTPVSSRKVYEGVAEISVYVDTNFHDKGIGSKLMHKVIISSELNGIWTLFSSIFPENMATRKLHEKHGFRVIGIREKIAQLDEKWRDTMILERRSKKVGIVSEK
ncbi:N-acetyltransferase family protein [Flavobacteriaceae bacterium M23B6Z8]